MKHKVGDIVTIREWDDMAGEFEVCYDGTIWGEGASFVPAMKKYCGTKAKIKRISEEGLYILGGTDGWHFSDCMFTDWKGGDNVKSYKDVTLVEYTQKKKEMFKSLGSESGRCDYRICGKCGFSKAINDRRKSCTEWELENPEEAARIVMEYEPEADWSKVPVDAKVLVRNSEEKEWARRHFAKFENGKVYVYAFGETSYTAKQNPIDYVYAKLYKEE